MLVLVPMLQADLQFLACLGRTAFSSLIQRNVGSKEHLLWMSWGTLAMHLPRRELFQAWGYVMKASGYRNIYYILCMPSAACMVPYPNLEESTCIALMTTTHCM